MSVELGRRKWEDKMANAGERWKAGLTGAEQRWAAALSAAGAPVGPTRARNYAQGIARVSAADFQAAVSGKGAKWAENFIRAMSL